MADEKEDILYLCDNQSVLTEVNGCIGEGGKATLATAPNADIMRLQLEAYREEPINEQADDVADDGRQADNDMSTQHGLEGWFSRKRASSEVGSLCGQMGYAHGWKPS